MQDGMTGCPDKELWIGHRVTQNLSAIVTKPLVKRGVIDVTGVKGRGYDFATKNKPEQSANTSDLDTSAKGRRTCDGQWIAPRNKPPVAKPCFPCKPGSRETKANSRAANH